MGSSEARIGYKGWQLAKRIEEGIEIWGIYCVGNLRICWLVWQYIRTLAYPLCRTSPNHVGENSGQRCNRCEIIVHRI